jgi:hypothetical protein
LHATGACACVCVLNARCGAHHLDIHSCAMCFGSVGRVLRITCQLSCRGSLFAYVSHVRHILGAPPDAFKCTADVCIRVLVMRARCAHNLGSLHACVCFCREQAHTHKHTHTHTVAHSGPPMPQQPMGYCMQPWHAHCFLVWHCSVLDACVVWLHRLVGMTSLSAAMLGEVVVDSESGYHMTQ